MEYLPLVFSTGWASGVNAYLVVLVLGIADRVGSVSTIPDVLGSWPVLVVAALMYAVEFVADKVPYVDSTWDAISTAIRPTVGAVIALLVSGDAPSLQQAVLVAVGGGTALASHLVKAGSRLAINTTPEPLSNIAASLSEDLAVLTVILFAVHHPRVSAAIAAVLLAAGVVLLFLTGRLVRRGWRRWKGKDRPRPSPT